MSYNGVGLNTARGSATNGYIQTNAAAIKESRKEDNSSGHYSRRQLSQNTEKQREKSQDLLNSELNNEIIDHDRKRVIEVKCMELRDKLEDTDMEDSEIDERVDKFRKYLTSNPYKERTTNKYSRRGRNDRVSEKFENRTSGNEHQSANDSSFYEEPRSVRSERSLSPNR